jgi:hypothetical protein
MICAAAGWQGCDIGARFLCDVLTTRGVFATLPRGALGGAEGPMPDAPCLAFRAFNCAKSRRGSRGRSPSSWWGSGGCGGVGTAPRARGSVKWQVEGGGLRGDFFPTGFRAAGKGLHALP